MITTTLFEIQYLMLLAFVGIIAGFVASSPPGPVNLWIASAVLKNPSGKVKYFVYGVILADLAYIALSFFFYFFFLTSTDFEIDKPWTILSGLLIAFIGLVGLIKNNQKIKNNPDKVVYKQAFSYFFTGLLICASNLMLFIFWLFIANSMESYNLEITDPIQFVSFLGGIFIGDILWFFIFIWFVKKSSSHFKPQNLYRLQKIIAISIIIFGLFTACK